MQVIKRDGRTELIQFDKITARNLKLSSDLSVDTISLSQTVIRGLSNGMTTRDIDQLSCESAIYRSIYEPDYGILAARIAWNDLHKNTPSTFRLAIDALYNNTNKSNGQSNPLLARDVYDFAVTHIDRLEAVIDYTRDYQYTYFAFKTLEKSYLQRVHGRVVERGQTMVMRVALGIHGPSRRNSALTGRSYPGDIDAVIKSYLAMSNRDFTHATPTMFNAGTNNPQYSSCFLLSVPDSLGDSNYDDDQQLIADGKSSASIPDSWNHCSLISKKAGGIGLDITRVRCNGSYISGTNGTSSGIIPLVKVFNEIGRYVNQGGKRKGAIAIYLEPWHPDTPEFLEIGLKTTAEEVRAKSVFSALWLPDLFFKRLETPGSTWSFFCPKSYPELITLYGAEFEARYIELELSGTASCRQMKTTSLWEKILKSIDETGLPYMHAKDEINNKSNQKNIGTITSSNLCCEVMQYHTPTSIAVCNLASISLPNFLTESRDIDWARMGSTAEMIVQNLNLVIDKTSYPIAYCADNNLKYRPMGIGFQGQADVFARMHLPWESREAAVLNQLFAECTYYHALKASNELAIRYGSYTGFIGSPAHKGILQYDMWTHNNLDPKTPAFPHDDPRNGKPVVPISHPSSNIKYDVKFTIPKYDWEALKTSITSFGLFNSLLLAPMPTATTAQILGNNEGCEPFTSNIYTRKVMAGDFPLVNIHLYRDLTAIGMWNRTTVNTIISNNGSVQTLAIPDLLKAVYKTVWEIPQRKIIDLAADRGAFIDQSQSMNIHLARPTPSKLSSMYMYARKKGLKTYSYYVRSQPAVDPVKFNIMDDNAAVEVIKSTLADIKSGAPLPAGYTCTGDVCLPCGS